jgi:tetratricopeptide (TPR) repeat protein
MKTLTLICTLSPIKKEVMLLFMIFTMINVEAQSTIENGKELFNAERYSEAQKVFATVNSKHPDFAIAQYFIGRIAFEKKQYDLAIDHFEIATNLDSENSEYFEWLGNAYSAFGWREGLLTQMSVGPKALKSLERAAKLDSKNISARVSLVGMYSAAPGIMGGGDAKARTIGLEVFKLLDNALSQTPENYQYLYWYGKVSAITGLKLQEGEVALEKFTNHVPKKNEPPLAGAYMRLGQIKEKQGDKNAAKKMYESALILDASLKEAKEGLNRLK